MKSYADKNSGFGVQLGALSGPCRYWPSNSTWRSIFDVCFAFIYGENLGSQDWDKADEILE
ncbi:hypothetical protein O9992_12400 [Vibrio lentus]|nr:hypothetical protein [Vibrio lentus]